MSARYRKHPISSHKLEMERKKGQPESAKMHVGARKCLGGASVDMTRVIYHLLSRSFGQCISVAEIVDFDVADVVAVGNVHFSVDVAGAGA